METSNTVDTVRTAAVAVFNTLIALALGLALVTLIAG
jgi:hypothetical protein